MALLAATPAFAADLPAYFKPPVGGEVVAGSVVEEVYGEANLPIADPPNVKQGRHFNAALRLPNADDSTHEGMWGPVRTALTAAGWTVAKYFDQNPPSATLRYQKGVDAWATITMFSKDDIRMDLIEVKPYMPTLALTPPAARPETIGPNDPFPYLKAAATLNSTDPDNGALYVMLKGDEEKTLISTQSVRKDYARIDGMSTLQFVLEYKNGLTKAGWEIVEQSQGLTQSDAVLVSHYARNGRDIWASLHFYGELAISVADISEDLAAKLAKECHLPLYGVTFEFNKAALRLESESTLQRVAAALQGNPALNVEVQGHTDNVGQDDYNLKLSQARADSVKAWLATHGVAAARLSAKGYGRNQPIADNGSDEGRAKNRRVELSAGCK
jgi:flagellar motor protein MotB